MRVAPHGGAALLLTLLAILVAALVVLAAIARFAPPRAVRVAGLGISGAVVVLAVVGLVQDGRMAMDLPVGPAGGALHLALDPLAASFLLLLFLVMSCADVGPLALAGAALTLLAADGFTVSAGLLLLGGIGGLRAAAAASVGLIAAFALADPHLDFAAMRAAPPEGWYVALVLLPAFAAAIMAARIDATITLYLLIRVLSDLLGPAQSPWWSAPLLAAGAAVAVFAALRAALADTVHGVLAAAPLQQAGMAAMALGVALLAGAVDLPSVAARALDAVWLAVVSQALCRALFGLCADSVEEGAGTRRFDRLGGLIHHMPVTAWCCLCGLFVVAALPPGLGFAAFWLVFQSLLAAARIGGLGLQVAIAGIAALTAYSVAMAALASVRLFSVAFLGRPRTPRAAAAEDVRWLARPAIGALAGFIVLIGLLPWLALLPASGWTGAAPSVPWLALRTGGETPGYAAVAVAALMAIVGFGLFRLRRRLGERQREPGWSGGFAAPPAWLPFGDPVTQYGAASFVEPLRRLLAVLPPMALPPGRLARSRAAMRAAVARVT